MKNSKDVYGAKAKTNVLLFDPADLKIVTDEKSALFDRRGSEDIEESFVLNVMHHGVLEPVIVRKNTETGDVEVVAGRRRVLASREANKRLKKQGAEPIQVPAVVRRGPDASVAAVMVIENEIRKADSITGRAEKMLRLQELGKSEDEIAIICGCSKATVKSTMSLLECSAPVRKAVDTGKIPASAAYALAKLPPDEQKTKLEEIATEPTSESGRVKKKKAVKKLVGATLRGKREIAAMREKFIAGPADEPSEAHDAVVKALSWVLGESEQIRLGRSKIGGSKSKEVRPDVVVENGAPS